MSLKDKIKELNINLLDIISTKEISYVKNTDKRINLKICGKFYYWRIYEIRNSKIWYFLNELEDDKIYTLIPLLSRNDRPDEPFITLSQQILITSNSSSLLLNDFLQNKIINTIELYNIREIEGVIIFKYKKVNINFNEHNSF